MKTALITGVAGQDGAYLAKFLLGKRYKVFGGDHIHDFWRLDYLGIRDKVELLPLDVLDSKSISEALISSTPNEVYHLAAQSFVGASFVQPLYTSEVTGLGTVRLLDEILKFNKKIKFYQASSSEMFGEDSSPNKNEKSAFKPVSPYAISKLYAYWMTRAYRKGYGMHASNGILFNHESPLRGLDFVTRKISNGVARISLGLSKSLKLGNLNSKRDWGYAPEYVEGMWKILQQKNPDDYVLSTDEVHSVKEFVSEAFTYLDLDWKKYVKHDKRFDRVLEVDYLKGNSSKAQKLLKWKSKIKFKKLVQIMVDSDLDRWQRWQKGERFAWDANNYIGDDKTVFRS